MSLYDGGAIALSEFGAMHGWAWNAGIDLGWVRSNCKWAYNDFNSYRNMVAYQKNNSGSAWSLVDTVPVWVGWYYYDTNPAAGQYTWTVGNANVYYRKARYTQNCNCDYWNQCWSNCNCTTMTASTNINAQCSQCDMIGTNCDTRWWYQPNCNCGSGTTSPTFNPLYYGGDNINCNCGGDCG